VTLPHAAHAGGRYGKPALPQLVGDADLAERRLLNSECNDGALAIIEQPTTLPALQIDLGLAMDFARASKSKATLAAYASDWREFECWCEDRRIPPLGATPEAIAATACVLSFRLEFTRSRCSSAT